MRITADRPGQLTDPRITSRRPEVPAQELQPFPRGAPDCCLPVEEGQILGLAMPAQRWATLEAPAGTVNPPQRGVRRGFPSDQEIPPDQVVVVEVRAVQPPKVVGQSVQQDSSLGGRGSRRRMLGQALPELGQRHGVGNGPGDDESGPEPPAQRSSLPPGQRLGYREPEAGEDAIVQELAVGLGTATHKDPRWPAILVMLVMDGQLTAVGQDDLVWSDGGTSSSRLDALREALDDGIPGLEARLREHPGEPGVNLKHSRWF